MQTVADTVTFYLVFNQLFAAVLCMGLVNCSSHKNPQQEIKPSGVIQGRLTIGPVCPGPERLDRPCEPPPEMYAAHRLIVLSADSSAKITEITMDGKGYYKMELPPGSYVMDFAPRDVGMPGGFPPTPFSIEQGKVTQLDLDIDTGMR